MYTPQELQIPHQSKSCFSLVDYPNPNTAQQAKPLKIVSHMHILESVRQKIRFEIIDTELLHKTKWSEAAHHSKVARHFNAVFSEAYTPSNREETLTVSYQET